MRVEVLLAMLGAPMVIKRTLVTGIVEWHTRTRAHPPGTARSLAGIISWSMLFTLETAFLPAILI